jgi:acetylxylan esterase
MKVFLIVLFNIVGTTVALAGTVTQINNFGENPTGIGMYVYTPSNVAEKPAVVVGVHACHGKGTDVCSSNNAFAQQADKWGFLLICPSSVSSDGCWDVHSNKVMTHNGGGDAQGIISMVNYVIAKLNGDANRVFVMGHSSGGMATNILLGSYPDVFKAGAAYAGVPFGCYGTGMVDNLGWNTNCAQGKVTKTGEEWGRMVRAAFPGFSGTRPRIQLWHGTKDDVLYFQNFKEEIKQWTNVLGVSETPSIIENNFLQPTWIRTRYKDANGVVQVEAIEETGQPHNLLVDTAEAMRFFGLDGANSLPDAGTMDGGRDTSLPDTVDSQVKQDVSMVMGGAPGMGGALGTGGRIDTGGATMADGTVASGGVTSTGGAQSTGGLLSMSGGLLQTGGNSSLGGVTISAGALANGGATMGGTNDQSQTKGGSSGCAIGTLGGEQGSVILAGWAFLVAIIGRRLRRISGPPNSPPSSTL